MRFQRQRIVLLRAISEGAEYKQHEISRRKIFENFFPPQIYSTSQIGFNTLKKWA